MNGLELNSFLDKVSPIRRGPVRFLLAAAVLGGSLLLTAILSWVFGSAQSSLFAIAIVLCTGALGLTAGLFACAIAAPTLAFFYIAPTYSLKFDFSTLKLFLLFSALAVGTHLLERLISVSIRKRAKSPLGIHGSVDGLVEGELYGWAFDADNPSHPIELTVFVDQHPVATVAAVHYRPDVAQALGCSGRHGFYVDLTLHLPEQSEALIDVKLPDRRSLTNAPARLWTPALTPRPSRPTVLYIHIPKTAGTAFREAITANFCQSEIAYLYPTEPGFLVSDLRGLPLDQLRALRLIVGHFHFGMHQALPQKSEYVTMVREPAARILSHYNYIRQTLPDLLRDEDNRFLSLTQMFEQRLTVNFDNALVRCFGGIDECEFPPGTLNQETFDRAVENLNAFTFIGHQESSGQAFSWLRRHYGWEAGQGLQPVNSGISLAGQTRDASEMAAIRHYNAWDFEFYREVLLRFPLHRAISA